MKVFYITLLLTAAFHAVSAQPTQLIDSLRKVVSVSKGDQRLDAMMDLAVELAEWNDLETMALSREVYTVSKKAADTTRMIRSGKVMAGVFRRRGQVDSSLVCYAEFYPMAVVRGNRKEIKSLLNLKGLAYLTAGKFDMALKNHFASLSMAEEDMDTLYIVHNLNNIGFVYYKLKDYAKAAAHFQRALPYTRGAGIQFVELRCLLNLGGANAYLKNYSEASFFTDQAAMLCETVDCAPVNRIVTDRLQSRNYCVWARGI